MEKKSTHVLLLFSFLFLSSFLSAQNRLGQGSSVNHYSAAITSNGKAVMWGLNTNGQLGNGGTDNAIAPADVYSYGALSGKSITKISAGNNHTLALTSEGTVYAWGNNGLGQAGLPDYIDHPLPAAVTLPGKAKAISAGYYHSLALMEDGTVYAWGNNSFGQCANGTISTLNTPAPIPALSNIVAISTGSNHSLALGSDGSVYAWGSNISGETLNGTPGIDNLTPRKMNVTGAIGLGCTANSSFALLADGSITGWGSNMKGELGTAPGATFVTNIGGLAGIKQISGGYNHVLALQANGTVIGWGANEVGQIGLGTLSVTEAPVVIPNLVEVKEISTGYNHSLALLANDCVYGWGTNFYGQLGNGSSTFTTVSIQSFCLPSSCTKPAVSFKTDVVCAGTPTTFTNTYSISGATYAWDVNSDGISDYFTPNIKHTYPAGGSYFAKLTITTALGCSNSFTGRVDVTSGPLVNAGADKTTYLGYDPMSSTTLSGMAVGGTGKLTYSWSTGAATSAITVAPAATTNYTLTVKDVKGCIGSDAVTVTVVDARCGIKLEKTVLCSPSRGTLCVPQLQVAKYLKEGFTLGACGSVSTTTSRIGYGTVGSNGDATTSAEPKPRTPFMLNKTNIFQASGSISVLNNPTTGIFKLRLSNLGTARAEIQVLNMNGVVVEKRLVNTEVSGVETFNLTNQAAGVYLIKVMAGSELKTAKVYVAR
jgi:alpha-tubulin suppressor-like RCC1 family protein